MAPRPGEAKSGGELRLRIVTGTVLGATGLFAVLAGGPWFAVLVALVALGMSLELARLLEAGREQRRRLRLLLLLGTLPGVMAPLVLPLGWALVLLAWGAGFAAAVRRLWGETASPAALGVVYLGLPLALLVWLRQGWAEGAWLTLWLLLVVAATDMGGYTVGRSLGGPRLAPRLSPGKTWSGLAGAAAFGSLGGLLAAWGLPDLPFSPLAAALFGAILALVAQLGDLAESWLKRRAGFKDSGRLLPGHGGLLDRFDGLLAASPLYAITVSWLEMGRSP